MTYPVLQRELSIHLNDARWAVRSIDEQTSGILGPVDYGWHRYHEYPDSFTFGEGLLGGSSIPGARRLVFCAFSPQWDGFYVSSMGGAAYTFHGLGVNYVSLRGQCKEPSVLLLNHKDGEIQVRLEPVDFETLWKGYDGPDDEPLIGFFALQQALLDRYAGEYPPKSVRVFAVGPAAQATREGAIGSSPVSKGRVTAVVDWCGRGGLGSRLLQQHNIVGCVFGGEWEDPDLRDSKELDGYFLEHFGQKVVKTDLAVTEKYRYHKELETGGTFGVNMFEISDRLLTHNYRSIYASAEDRQVQHKTFILDHYLKQFNEETIQSKQFQHCGEPCAVACKKLNGKYKKDYEPYHACGPQLGVFDQRAAELLNDYVDAMGFDAIQTGGTLAWIMECIAESLLKPEEFGFPPASEMNFTYSRDTEGFDLVEDSMRNASYAMTVLKAILFDERAGVFREGIRAAAHKLDRQKGTRTIDCAVFLAHGEDAHHGKVLRLLRPRVPVAKGTGTEECRTHGVRTVQ
jgi:glyceraldehyde-3-phosphate dehydrogenase (ferredoxin)